jgi:hypothetical protein
MSLEIIGAGFGRTGTLSLKLALEELGLGPCYHMITVHAEPERAGDWIDAISGDPVDWDRVFDGFQSTVDWPACHFWRELADYYPRAKVLLSKREASGWYKNVINTIANVIKSEHAEDAPGRERSPLVMAPKIVLDAAFGGDIDDEASAIRAFEAHNKAVCDAIAPDRLLVYEPGHGWEPLCEFFGVPAPDTDYPHANTTESFQEMFASFAEGRTAD